MGDPYNTSHDNGYGYATGDGSLNINMNSSNRINAILQQGIISQNTLSPITTSRHDSIHSQSPQISGFPTGQHQAESQPYAAHLTPHVNKIYPYRSEDMARGTSHASHHSSASSGHQYGGSPHFTAHHSFPDIYSPIGIDMQRSQSLYSNNSTIHNQNRPGVSQTCQPSANHYSPGPMDVFSTNPFTTIQYSPPIMSLDNSSSDYHLGRMNRLDSFGNNVDLFGLNSSE
jgi:hypothetical protein